MNDSFASVPNALADLFSGRNQMIKRSVSRDDVKDLVREELEQLLKHLEEKLPGEEDGDARAVLRRLRDALLARCPVCRCPDYRWRKSVRAYTYYDTRSPFDGLTVGMFFPTYKTKLVPGEGWTCAHCEADQQFLQGPVMWSELLDLRESVIVDDLSYEDFCRRELELFEQFMSAEDIEFSNRMGELAHAASFNVEYQGQGRSLRTGLLVRRFQILQFLHGTLPKPGNDFAPTNPWE